MSPKEREPFPGRRSAEREGGRRAWLCVVGVALSFAVAIVAQEGHPVVGTWYGD